MHAYDKTYLDSAMDNLGTMIDCAVNHLGIPMERFYLQFLSSGIDREIEKGNPRFLAGMSGEELVWRVLDTEVIPLKKETYFVHYGPEYWVGWVLALLQWETGLRFKDIQYGGMDVLTILSLYPTLHEADSAKFLDVAIARMDTVRKSRPTRLKELRKAAGLTQQQLAARAGVSVRAVQSYEQRYLDISKAEVRAVSNMAEALGCSVEELLYETRLAHHSAQ